MASDERRPAIDYNHPEGRRLKLSRGEFPTLADLAELSIDATRGEELWIHTFVAESSDGDEVTVSWDVEAASIHVAWRALGYTRMVMEREEVTKLSVRKTGASIEIHAWLHIEGISGKLVVEVGDRVSISDAILSA